MFAAGGCMLPVEEVEEPKDLWAYQLEERVSIDGEYARDSESPLLIELDAGKPIWRSSDLQHRLPLSSLSPSDAAHFLLPKVEVWEEGRRMRRTWLLDRNHVRFRMRDAAPSLHEHIGIESCGQNLCDVSWERHGPVDLGLHLELWQRGKGVFDLRHGRYRSVELTTWTASLHGERTSTIRLEYDGDEVIRQLARIEELEERTRQAAAGFDAWVASHPGAQEARLVVERQVTGFDRALRRAGCMSGVMRAAFPLSFYALSQPDTVWDALSSLPPSEGRQWAMERAAGAQHDSGMELGEQAVDVLAAQAERHRDLGLELPLEAPTRDDARPALSQGWAVDVLERGRAVDGVEGITAASYLASQPPSGDARDALVVALDAADPNVRLSAARALYRWGDPRGLRAMVDLLLPWRPEVPPEEILLELAGELPTMLGFERAYGEGQRAEAIGRLREWARRRL